jgi:hypothetical protein
VAEDDARVGRAHRAQRLDEVLVAQRQRHAAHQTRRAQSSRRSIRMKISTITLLRLAFGAASIQAHGLVDKGRQRQLTTSLINIDGRDQQDRQRGYGEQELDHARDNRVDQPP